MPIRFRCAYCNQLLGIARRKAGTVIRCPTCAGQVVVPDSGEKPTGPLDQPLFERSDFEQMLNPSPSAGPRPPAAAPAGAWGTHGEPPFDVERLHAGPFGLTMPAAGQGAGIVLSPGKATLLTVLVVVFIALAFGVGFLVGRAF